MVNGFIIIVSADVLKSIWFFIVIRLLDKPLTKINIDIYFVFIRRVT